MSGPLVLGEDAIVLVNDGIYTAGPQRVTESNGSLQDAREEQREKKNENKK